MKRTIFGVFLLIFAAQALADANPIENDLDGNASALTASRTLR